MFSMFSSYSRYSSYGRDDSSDEEEKSSQFTLQQRNNTNTTEGMVNAALEEALKENGEEESNIIRLETDDVGDGMDIDTAVASQLSHLCIECADQPASVTCLACDDQFCDVCFMAMHKRGTRAKHQTRPYQGGNNATPAASSSEAAPPAPTADTPSSPDTNMEEESSATTPPPAASSSSSATAPRDITDDDLENAFQRGRPNAAGASSSALSDDSDSDITDDDSDSVGRARYSRSGDVRDDGPIVLPSRTMNSSLISGSSSTSSDWFLERAKYIPMRLTLEERKFLRLLEATLNVSEYTDKIDIVTNKDKMTRIKEQLRDLCSILSGLVVANDYKLGQKLLKDKEFADNAEFFRSVFELGRRHKIRNPEKMRSSYGKLVFILQDSVNPAIEELMGFHLVAPLKTAYTTLEDAGALDCLRDPRMMTATGDIKTEGRGRPEIERDIKAKNDAVAALARQYKNSKIDEEGVRACILSIADNHTFLMQNRFCCDVMLEWLTTLYHPSEPRAPWSLAILGGRQGARLTHSHANQYAYVMQSLTLWREILHDFFSLWCKSEQDLMDPQNSYRLRNTGQGLNRVQSAPRVGKAMHNILHHCQRKLGHWVGSSVIHLGDHNVPNSLMFIDKYSQVSRILNPIVLTIKSIPRLCEKADVKFYIDKIFGGPEKLRLLILTDFFKHAFDGSGADNFFDAGSCIDGRLTSAWNWCNKLEKKSFYPIFQLAGFNSFDGQWSD